MNTDGSYECTCPKGFYWNNEECVDSSNMPDDPNCNVPEFIKKPHSRYDISLGENVIIECEGDSGDLVYWTKGLDGKQPEGNSNAVMDVVFMSLTNLAGAEMYKDFYRRIR